MKVQPEEAELSLAQKQLAWFCPKNQANNPPPQ